MKKILGIILLCLSITVNGQSNLETQSTTSIKTEHHINIPGTRLYIVPPAGFIFSSSFLGMQKGANSAIQIHDFIGGNYYTNAATFSKEKFEKKGINVFEYKEFQLNGFPAKYIFMQSAPNEKGISLVFGDTSFSTMIMAIYPSYDSKTGEEIQKSLKTVYYDKNHTVNPFSSASFSLDDSKSAFKFSKSISGMFLYSLDGIDKKRFEEDPFISVLSIPKDNTMTPKGISEMSVSNLKQKGLMNSESKNDSMEDVNGYTAYEVEVYGNLKGKKSLIYQLIISGSEKMIMIQGIAKSKSMF